MCGIVGFKSRKDFCKLKDDLPKAIKSLSHRGPNDSGFFFDEISGTGLGHTRLSIIDLSPAGHQPMGTDDGKVQIVFNGEIYNFKAIRSTLGKYGYQFKSNSDTEVVLNAYLHWGIDCCKEFNGMFAIAIWDAKEQSIYIARDRIGEKPLYYFFDNEVFLFASELKALMAFKNFEKNIDFDAISLFLHYQYIPAPKTIFKKTYKLLPGTFLKYDGKQISTHHYWEYPEKTGDNNINEEDALNDLDALLTDAVSIRLMSDVPLGALLSGGIDSTIVVALMQKVNKSPVKTFSIGFEEKGYNEAPWAKEIAKYLGTDHTELYVKPDDALNIIPFLPEIYDEPFADSSAIPTSLVSKLTKSRVTVALSGDGGDEQFAGYVRYWSTQAMAQNFSRFPYPVKKLSSRILKKIPTRWIEKCYRPLYPHLPQRFKIANFYDKWEKLIKLFDKTEISELYKMTICLWSREDIIGLLGRPVPESNYEKIFVKTQNWPVISRLMHVDQQTYLPDAMLTKVDRASMAVGLEVRVPLLDHRIMEYTSNLPDSLKYRNGSGKYILKKLLSRYVPNRLFERPKMGFGVPLDRWLRNELKDLLLDYLSRERIKSEGLFDYSIIDKTVKEHLSGKINHQHRLWSLLMWEMWREKWLQVKTIDP